MIRELVVKYLFFVVILEVERNIEWKHWKGS
jgi:hypothetical protein